MLPTGIIFINSDAVDGYVFDGYSDGYIAASLNIITRNTLITQLFIDQFMDGYTFDQNVLTDINYVNNIHLQGKRILVSRGYGDYNNRNLADVVLFYSHGNVAILKSNFGPPGLSVPITNVSIYTLLRAVGSSYVVILPMTATRPPHSLGGIVVDQLADSSGVHCVNPDNIYNNPDFINRK